MMYDRGPVQAVLIADGWLADQRVNPVGLIDRELDECTWTRPVGG